MTHLADVIVSTPSEGDMRWLFLVVATVLLLAILVWWLRTKF